MQGPSTFRILGTSSLKARRYAGEDGQRLIKTGHSVGWVVLDWRLTFGLLQRSKVDKGLLRMWLHLER